MLVSGEEKEENMKAKISRRVFPFGSHLCRQPMPEMKEVKQDMENLKRHGFNLIKIQEHWMMDEPEENNYDFAVLEELVDYARKLNLGVYLGLTLQQAPFWLFEKYPDARMVGRNGLPISYVANSTLPADGKPGPCPDHPGVIEAENRFLTKLVSVLAGYENIVIWNTWQEIGYWAEGITGQSVCYCPYTLNFFRRYLQEKYQNLENLNRCWKTRYPDWRYITPSRHIRNYFEIQTLEWNYFMDNVQIARCLQRRCEIIKKADPLKRPVFAHKGAPLIGSTADWTYARCQDFLGCSNYPAWAMGYPWDDDCSGENGKRNKHYSLVSEMYDNCVLKFDYLRSCQEEGQPVWAAEFQGGPVATGLHPGRVPSPEDIRRWIFSCLGSNLTGICFWVTRAEILPPEINGFSLLDSTGDITARFQEAGRIAAALNRFAELFSQPNLPSAPVGILIDELNYQGCRLLEKAENHLVYSIRTWHRLFWENNILADFVSLQHNREKLSRYQVLILPFPLFLSEETAEILMAYVNQGGHLISGPCPGRINQYGFCPRGEISPCASKLFGVKHEKLILVAEPQGEKRWSFLERTWGEYVSPVWLAGTGVLNGEKLMPYFFLETFSCQKSQPCLKYGDKIAGTVARYKKGTAWLLGTLASYGVMAYRKKENVRALLSILSQCGVKPDYSGRLVRRRRAGKDAEAWIFTNPGKGKITEEIEIPCQAKVQNLSGDKLIKTDGKLVLTLKPLEVRILIILGGNRTKK